MNLKNNLDQCNPPRLLVHHTLSLDKIWGYPILDGCSTLHPVLTEMCSLFASLQTRRVSGPRRATIHRYIGASDSRYFFARYEGTRYRYLEQDIDIWNKISIFAIHLHINYKYINKYKQMSAVRLVSTHDFPFSNRNSQWSLTFDTHSKCNVQMKLQARTAWSVWYDVLRPSFQRNKRAWACYIQASCLLLGITLITDGQNLTSQDYCRQYMYIGHVHRTRQMDCARVKT